jgi:putative heme-binding domain-containing protein
MRPFQQIRESVMDPDADGWQTYRGVTVVMRDGKTIRGVARNRTNYSMQVQDAQGKLHLLSSAEMRDVVLSKGSPMPGDFAKRLSKQEMEDLLAFLSRQSLRAAETTEKK